MLIRSDSFSRGRIENHYRHIQVRLSRFHLQHHISTGKVRSETITLMSAMSIHNVFVMGYFFCMMPSMWLWSCMDESGSTLYLIRRLVFCFELGLKWRARTHNESPSRPEFKSRSSRLHSAEPLSLFELYKIHNQITQLSKTVLGYDYLTSKIVILRQFLNWLSLAVGVSGLGVWGWILHNFCKISVLIRVRYE